MKIGGLAYAHQGEVEAGKGVFLDVHSHAGIGSEVVNIPPDEP
jgi:hypothetical protein